MNMATESTPRKRVSSRTSLNLNSRPEAADTKTRAARAGYEPRQLHQDAEQDHGEGQHDQGPDRPVALDLLVAAQPPDHDVDAEQDEYPTQNASGSSRVPCAVWCRTGNSGR